MRQAMHRDRGIAGIHAAGNQAVAPEAEPTMARGLLHHAQSNARLILGLLALQADRAGDPDMRREMGGLVAQALATAHERPDRDGVATVGLAAYLRELCDRLAGFQLGLGTELALDVTGDAAVATGDAVTLGLIVNELVADAAERALPGGGGSIRIELQAGGADEARLIVVDDGRSPSTGRGSGPDIDVAEALAARLGAELAIAPFPKRGAQAVVAFPLGAP